MEEHLKTGPDEEQPGQQAGPGFSFGKAESLIDDDASPEGEEVEVVEGELQTVDEIARLQSRSVVGVMDMLFQFKDSDHEYDEKIYKAGERHISPALISLGIKIPGFEVFNAVSWVVMQSLKSIKGIKLRRAKRAK